MVASVFRQLVRIRRAKALSTKPEQYGGSTKTRSNCLLHWVNQSSASACSATTVLAFKRFITSWSCRQVLNWLSTKMTDAAPREAASKPKAPLPEKRSRQRAPEICGASQLKTVSRTLSGVGRNSFDPRNRMMRFFHWPPIIRTLPCCSFRGVFTLNSVSLFNWHRMIG